MVAERLVNFVIGPPLLVGEGGGLDELSGIECKAVDFLLVDFKDATLAGGAEHGGGGIGPLEQGLFCDLVHRFAVLQPVREVEVGEQQGFLFGCPLQLVKVLMQHLFVITCNS